MLYPVRIARTYPITQGSACRNSCKVSPGSSCRNNENPGGGQLPGIGGQSKMEWGVKGCRNSYLGITCYWKQPKYRSAPIFWMKDLRWRTRLLKVKNKLIGSGTPGRSWYRQGVFLNRFHHRSLFNCAPTQSY